MVAGGRNRLSELLCGGSFGDSVVGIERDSERTHAHEVSDGLGERGEEAGFDAANYVRIDWTACGGQPNHSG